MSPARIAVIGAGAIGQALLVGLTEAGYPPGDLAFVHRTPTRGAELSRQLGIAAVPLATAATYDVAILAVKPQDSAQVLRSIAPAALRPGTLVMSLCAGVTIATIESLLPAGIPIVRAMPNTALTIGAAITAVSGGTNANEAHPRLAETILGSVGKVVRLSESHQDAVTAVSGSGPAYVYYLVEAMVDAATEVGLPREVATQLVIETAYGAVAMLRHTDRAPAELRDDVTSPGGTTNAAVDQLDARRVRAAVTAAIIAAHNRSVELSTGGSVPPTCN